MQLWLTVVDPASAPEAPPQAGVTASRGPTVTDYAVDCDEGTTSAELAAALRGAPPDDLAVPLALTVDGVVMTGDELVGLPPLLDGAQIWLDHRASADIHGRPEAVSLRPDHPVLCLHVVAGPDAGGCHPLGPGRHRLGRAAEADLRIQDPELSRVHLGVEVRSDRTLVQDCGSSNGSWVDHERLSGTPRPWAPGERLRAGSSVLELCTHGSPRASTRPDRAGHLLVSRPPRLRRPTAVVEVRLPERPESPARGRVPVLAALLPLALSAVMAQVEHSPTYLLFGLMSPGLLVGGWLSERHGGRRRHREAVERWRHDAEEVQAQLVVDLRAEAAVRRTDLPDLVQALLTARTPLARLWERRPEDDDLLHVRVGLGRLPSQTRTTTVGETGRPQTPLVDDVPARLDLAALAVVGIAGLRLEVEALTRSIVAQLAAWHSPDDLELVLLTTDPASWSWVTWLPHCRADPRSGRLSRVGRLDRPEQVTSLVEALLARIESRTIEISTSRGPSSGSHPRVVVLVDGAQALRAVPGVARVLAEGPGVGVHAICLAGDAQLLPAECRAVLDVHGGTAELRSDVPHPALAAIRVDAVSEDWADRFARALARLRDDTPREVGGLLPTAVRLVDLVGDRATDGLSLADAWRQVPFDSRAVVGVDAQGPVALDLCRDGPHLLVGGTTGSGKSELLQTLVASMALAATPDRLSFVLVDYKGGSAFDRCADLPHTLGVVTDLDAHLAERALASLGAELRRRESLLRVAGAKDVDELVRLSSGAPPFGRLVIVVDEFRMLAEELPAFVDGIVRVAALGRSLGVHLVLATQRPAGVVSADIAANVNLRIALRVRDQVDSQDVIDARDAAWVSASTPGRALLRAGAGPLVTMQTARVSGCRPPQRRRIIRLTPLTWDARASGPRAADPPDRSASPSRSRAESDLDRIVHATRAATQALGVAVPPSPWLPALPHLVLLEGLAATRPQGEVAAVPYGLADRPSTQSQPVLAWDLTAGSHLAFVGSARSGRTSALRTLAGALATQLSPHDAHIHGLDGGGDLLGLSVLPHVGVVVGRNDPARAARLLERLEAMLSRRHNRFAAMGFGSLEEHNLHVHPDERLPYAVLLVDGWERMAAAWEGVDRGAPVEALTALARDRTAAGLRLAVTGERALLTSRLASSLAEKVVLRLADASDLLLAGVPAARLPREQPAGRGLLAGDHTEVQVAVLAAGGAAAEAVALRQIAAQSHEPGPASPTPDHRPIRLEPLPARVSLADLSPPSRSGPVLVGIGDDEASSLALELGGSVVSVIGAARSGRTTTLAVLCVGIRAQGRPLVVVRSGRWLPLAAALDPADLVDALASDAASRLAGRLASRPESVVLVDDAERLLDSPAEAVILDWLADAERPTGSLVVASNPSDLAFRGLTVTARRSGVGIVLMPTSYAEGDLLGVRLPPLDRTDQRPGRGYLVQGGTAVPIQVACLDGRDEPGQ